MTRNFLYSPAELTDLLDLHFNEATVLKLNKLKTRALLSSIVDDLRVIVGARSVVKWIRASNPSFEGRSAIEVMLGDTHGVERVQRYVKAVAINPW